MPGPKRVSILFFRSSMPSISYSSSTSSGSKLQASKGAVRQGICHGAAIHTDTGGSVRTTGYRNPQISSSSSVLRRGCCCTQVTFGEHMPTSAGHTDQVFIRQLCQKLFNVIFPSDTSASFQPRSPAYSLCVGLSLRVCPPDLSFVKVHLPSLQWHDPFPRKEKVSGA